MISSQSLAVEDPTITYSYLNKNIELDPPFEYAVKSEEGKEEIKFINEVNLEDSDPFTQYTFKEWVVEHHKQQLGYIIAITKDALNQVSIYDGCSLVRHYYTHDQKTSPLNRADLTDMAFYRLPPSKESLKFHSVCQKEDLYLGDWFLSFIAAHDLTIDSTSQQQRAANQFKVGLLYERPLELIKDDTFKKVINFFKENVREAFYWYQRSAEGENAHAYSRLGSFYRRGIACNRSEIEAFKCVKKAHELLPLVTEYTRLLAFFYLKGIGTAININEVGRLLTYARVG